MGRTTIQVSDELADELHERKGRGESYEDVIWELIGRGDASAVEDNQQPPETHPPGKQEPEPSADSDGAESGVGAFLSPVGYDVPDLEQGERYRGAWWRRVVKPGLEAHPDVEKPGEGESEWEYTGE